MSPILDRRQMLTGGAAIAGLSLGSTSALAQSDRIESLIAKMTPAEKAGLKSGDVIESAVNEVFEEVDEGALLDRAFERRLRGQAPKDLDEKGRARIVRGLAAQGFTIGDILKRFRGLE